MEIIQQSQLSCILHIKVVLIISGIGSKIHGMILPILFLEKQNIGIFGLRGLRMISIYTRKEDNRIIDYENKLLKQYSQLIEKHFSSLELKDYSIKIGFF